MQTYYYYLLNELLRFKKTNQSPLFTKNEEEESYKVDCISSNEIH